MSNFNLLKCFTGIISEWPGFPHPTIHTNCVCVERQGFTLSVWRTSISNSQLRWVAASQHLCPSLPPHQLAPVSCQSRLFPMEVDAPPIESSLDQSVAPSWLEFPWPKCNNQPRSELVTKITTSRSKTVSIKVPLGWSWLSQQTSWTPSLAGEAVLECNWLCPVVIWAREWLYTCIIRFGPLKEIEAKLT